MSIGLTTLFFGALAVVIFGKIDGAIQCHQCSDCGNAGNLPGMKECMSITVVDAYGDLTGKLLEKSNPRLAKVNITQSVNMAKMVMRNTIPHGTMPGSCFKMAAKIGDEEVVYRGCMPENSEYDCKEMGGITTCACTGDGCNGAKAILGSAAFITCLAILSAFVHI